MANKLTPKQQRFIDEYLVDLNATQAAIRAGYSEKTARQLAARLLTNVNIQAELQKKQGKLQGKLEITQEKVLQELASIAFANGADFAQVVRGAGVYITPTDQLPPEKLPAIAGIKEGANGIEVKLHDKVRALELLSKYLGILDNPAPQTEKANNLFDAIDNCGEEDDFSDLPEIQQTAESDAALVEDESPSK